MMRRMIIFTSLFLSISIGRTPGQMPTYDVLIRGGRVIDGTGNPWFSADVAIKDGRIVAIGRLEGATATRVIDARGLYVVPGFIDVHSHADEGLGSPRTNANPNMITQGVTTVVVNQDGRSPWPIAEQKALYERQGIGTNVILLVGHGTVRRLVMGEDIRRPATPEEIERMKALVRQGLEEGAFGLSAGLEYVPGRWSTTEELIELAKVVAAYGGFYIAHQRSEGRDPMWKNASDPTPSVDLLQAVKETIEISARSGVVAVASHLKAKGASYWGSSYAAVRLIAEARERGLPVYADQYPYDTTGTDGQTVLIPLWALAEEGVEVGGQLGQLARDRTGAFARMKENLRRRLADPTLREKIRLDIAHEIDRRGGPERILVYEFPDPELIGKSLAEIARRRGEDPVDAALWMQLNGLDRPGGARMRGFSLSELDIEHIMRQEFTATCSDAGTVAFGEGIPHPRYYGTFPRKIRRYVFERGVISLPFAIRSMTSLPAQIIGLRDRGLLREGYWADITIFDPEKIADRATYTEPHQYADGILYVLVNGEFVVDEGKITGKRPGRVLTPAR
ncbi:N-acyl-D-aspartate deacylase [bacterium HR08]|nr:N-acyl-D-aspartate deacylase [bacterium HR08]